VLFPVTFLAHSDKILQKVGIVWVGKEPHRQAVMDIDDRCLVTALANAA
jgi:hypothetical protein